MIVWVLLSIPMNLSGAQAGGVVSWGSKVLPPFDSTPLVAIAAGGIHTLALKADGTVAAWGDNTLGESSPPAGLSNVVAVAAGDMHCVALKSDGTVVAWGNDGYGQNQVPQWPSRVIAIADGADHSLAIVAPPFRVSNPHWQNGIFTVSVPTQIGKSYQLEYKSGLLDSIWTPLPSVPGTGLMLTLTDPSASLTQRFYRVSEQ